MEREDEVVVFAMYDDPVEANIVKGVRDMVANALKKIGKGR